MSEERTRYTANEILSADFPPETAEEAYRRGYVDGMIVYADYLAEGVPADWLARFRERVLFEWMRTETDKEIWPPLPDLWIETDEGFRLRTDDDPKDVWTIYGK
ncbi:MAG: hypothetical protein R3C14_28725 [Caldilineaceae bacterium]